MSEENVEVVREPKCALKLSGGLLLGGFLLNAVVTMAFHPSGAEDDHEAIFTEYAESGGWVATHLGQFVGVLLALAGLFVLARALQPEAPHLAAFAAVGTVATAATWAVLQGLDGVRSNRQLTPGSMRRVPTRRLGSPPLKPCGGSSGIPKLFPAAVWADPDPVGRRGRC